MPISRPKRQTGVKRETGVKLGRVTRNMATRKIGLMGGTFDPIHFGHLFLAESARVECDLDEVIFFPNNTPAHAQGKNANADAATRLEMTRLATQNNPFFRVSDIEIARGGKSYAYDTILEFQALFGAQTELFFIVGADSMRDISTWYRGAQLFELCRFIASTRPGYNLENAKNALEKWQQERTVWLQTPGLHISSSELRARVAGGLPARYLVPDAVLNVIETRNLYLEVGS